MLLQWIMVFVIRYVKAIFLFETFRDIFKFIVRAHKIYAIR